MSALSALAGHLRAAAVDVVPLLLRVLGGGFMLTHGIPKLLSWAESHATFPDPLGVGSTASMALTIFGEVVCAGLLLLGAFTRVAAIPAAITMAVAAFVVHGGDPFGKRELALLYLGLYSALFFSGAGRVSVDGTVFKGRCWS